MLKLNLLFKNNFKNTVKNKIQLVSLIILVFLTSLVFSINEISKTRVTNSYNDFISTTQSNQHDFLVDFNNTTYVSNSKSDNFSNIGNLEMKQNAVIDDISQKLKTNNSPDNFNYFRVEARTFYCSTNKILKTITLNPNQTTDKFIVSSGMPLKIWSRYQQAVNRYSQRWVYLNQKFADNNNIKINDIIRLQNDNYGHSLLVKKDCDISKYYNQDINQWLPNSPFANANWFRVVGFGASADLVTPIIDSTHPIPDMKNQGLVYIDPFLFGLENSIISLQDGTKVNVVNTNTNQTLVNTSSNDREIYYVGKFNNSKDVQLSSKHINQIINSSSDAQQLNLGSYFIKIGDGQQPIATYKSDNSYLLSSRITFLETTLKAYRITSYLIIITTLLLSFFALVLVVKKQIENTRIQTGILRSLGYHKHNIIISYFSYPLMIAWIGGISGYLIGLSSQQLVISFFKNYFNFVFQPFVFTFASLFVCVFGIFILLTFVTAITTYIMMAKPPVVMINGDMINRRFLFKQAIKKQITFKQTFNSRFKATLFSTSIGKMVGVAMTMIIVTALVALSTTIPMILQDNLNYSYSGVNYKTDIQYYNPTYNIPTSFYKTYDPSIKPWNNYQDNNNYYMNSSFKTRTTNMTDNLDQLLEQYQTGKINAETYSPTLDATDLTSLLYKNISKKYLESNKITINDPSGYLTPLIIASAWIDYKNMGLAKFATKTDINDAVGTWQVAQTHVQALDLLRNFYLKYRNTIALDIQRQVFFTNKNTINLDNPELFNENDYFKNGIIPDNKLKDGHLKNEKGIYTPFSQIVSNPNSGYLQVQKLTYDIFNWYHAYFNNNIEQGFIQGIYAQAPDSLRKQIAQDFKEKQNNYNILFGVVPNNPDTDDLGTYFNANYQKQNFKVFGINQTSKTQKLTSSAGNNLLKTLYQSSNNNSIILNASLAKLLNVNVGQTITLNQYRNALYQNNKIVPLSSWDANKLSAIDASGNSTTNSKYLYDQNVNWVNKSINPNDDGYVLQSTINPMNPTPVTATIMEKDASAGNLMINNENITNNNYIVKGITNQYGEAKAWVKTSKAEQVTGYDQSKATLFQTFLKEWIKPYAGNSTNPAKALVQALNSRNFATTDPNQYQSQYQKFINDPNMKTWQTIFNNEYPVFNYKLSQANDIDDINHNLSTSQIYGDYSTNGLVGGVSTIGKQYNAYKISSINNLISIATAQKITAHIYHIINIMLIIIIALACALALLMIILTSNVIIAENLKIIATMKILGYSNNSITKLVLGMYFPIVAITTIIGFGFGWGFLCLGISLFLHHGLVFPIIFKWWLPLISIITSYLLYGLAYLMSWKVMTKINSLNVISDI